MEVAKSKVILHRRALTLWAAKGLYPFGIPESGSPVPRAQGVIGNKDLYDLALIGVQSYTWQPTVPVQEYIKAKMDYYIERDYIKLCAPKLPSKKGVVYVTYSGPHTGIRGCVDSDSNIRQLLYICDSWR